jgi:hypothetical protein
MLKRLVEETSICVTFPHYSSYCGVEDGSSRPGENGNSQLSCGGQEAVDWGRLRYRERLDLDSCELFTKEFS